MFKYVAGALIGTLALATSAMATPIYSGNTVATYGESTASATDDNPTLPTASGYYIWSNETRDEWSVRWTGNGNNNTGWYDWWGSIELGSSTELTSTTNVLFEAGHSDDLNIYGQGIPGLSTTLVSSGEAGPHWDGFDFTIDILQVGEVIGFNLGSTLFDFSSYSNGDEAEFGGVFIGDGLASPLALYQGAGSSTPTQNFEIAVTEPGSVALFGLGLVGLGFARRKQSK